MTTEQLILQELRKLTGKVELLKKELNELKMKIGSVPSYPFEKPHFDGPNPHNPFVEPLPLFFKEYKDKVNELLEKWKQNPDKAPQYGNNGCSKCGISFENGALGYSCPNSDCPCGMGPTTC